MFLCGKKCTLGLIQIPEVNAHQLTHPGFLHGYPIDYIHSTHRHFIVGYDDELRVAAELPDHIGELANVCIIQRSVYLIEDTEWCRLYKINSKKQCRCG